MADVIMVETSESLAYAQNVGEFYEPINSSTFCLCSPVKLSNSQLPSLVNKKYLEELSLRSFVTSLDGEFTTKLLSQNVSR
jgi:hypothetical protein